MRSGGIGIPIRVEGQQRQNQQQQQQNQQNGPNRPDHSDQRPSVVDRLHQLEADMDAEAAGAFRLPADRELTERLAAFLATRHPHADLQITVSCERRQITTKQQYETETPGMIGLPADQLQDLQRKLMAKISAQPFEHAKPEAGTEQEKPVEEEWARRGPADVQQSEAVEEGVGPTDEQGTMLTKKRTHVLTTSQSQVKGLEAFQPQYQYPSGIPVPQQQQRAEDGGVHGAFRSTTERERTIPVRRV